LAEVEKIMGEQHEREENEKINAAVRKVKQFEAINKHMINAIKRQVQTLSEDNARKDELLN
jgi:hypothetical protein